MQEKHLFEYAVIRIVPRVEREEFLNVGVVVFCKKLNFLQMKHCIDEARILAAFPAADISDIQQHLQAYENISHGQSSAGPIAALDTASRFRWLTAKRSTIVQSSPVHPGFSADPAITLQKLYEQQVLCD